MAQIAELNNAAFADEEDGNYLYKKDVYVEEGATPPPVTQAEEEKKPHTDEDGFELPDFIGDDDDVIKID